MLQKLSEMKEPVIISRCILCPFGCLNNMQNLALRQNICPMKKKGEGVHMITVFNRVQLLATADHNRFFNGIVINKKYENHCYCSCNHNSSIVHTVFVH